MDFDAVREGLTETIPYNRHLSLEIVEVGDGTGLVRLPEGEELANHVGTQHAGGLFSVAEAASAAAFLGAFRNEIPEITPVTRSARIEFLKMAHGPILASARLGEPKEEIWRRVQADGRVDFSVEVELTDEAGTKVAEVTVRWHIRRKRVRAPT